MALLFIEVADKDATHLMPFLEHFRLPVLSLSIRSSIFQRQSLHLPPHVNSLTSHFTLSNHSSPSPSILIFPNPKLPLTNNSHPLFPQSPHPNISSRVESRSIHLILPLLLTNIGAIDRRPPLLLEHHRTFAPALNSSPSPSSFNLIRSRMKP